MAICNPAYHMLRGNISREYDALPTSYPVFPNCNLPSKAEESPSRTVQNIFLSALEAHEVNKAIQQFSDEKSPREMSLGFPDILVV